MPWSKDRPRARQGKKLPEGLRRKIIKRDRERGVGCYFQFLDICTGLEGRVEVHHIHEVEDTGGVPDNSEGNLAAACKPCHTRWSARQAQKRAVKAGAEWKRQPERHPGILD